MFSARTAWNLEPNRLARALAARRRDGRPVLDLTDTNPLRCGIPYPDDEVRRAVAGHGRLRYDPHPRGGHDARAAVAAYATRSGLPTDADRVVLTAGTSEAYAHLFRILADPGDRVLVPQPSYPLFEHLAALGDVRTAAYPLRLTSGRWRIDLDALRDAATPDVRAVVVVNPNNPTGSGVDAEERRVLHALARERDLALLADEVFAEYAHEPGSILPRIAGAGQALTFTLGGLSKLSGLPHLKLAWILVHGPDSEVREALARLDVVTDAYLTVSTPVQEALPELIALGDGIRSAIHARVRENRVVVRDLLSNARGLDVLPSDAGWCAVLADARGRDDEAWALELLERDGVLVHPGHFYDFAEEGRLVVSLLVPQDVLREGVLRIARRAV